MKTSEALKTIENIENLLKSNNRAFVDPRQMAILGFTIMLIPLFEISLDMTLLDSFLYDKFSKWGVFISRVLFYGLSFRFIEKRFNQPKEKLTNPLIKKAFSINKIFACSCLFVGVGMTLAEKPELAYPLIFILMGLFYNLLGKFINKSFLWASWFYLLISPIYMYLTKLSIENLWMYFLLIHGLSYLAIAYYSHRFDKVK